jgi:Carboxylesterase family
MGIGGMAMKLLLVLALALVQCTSGASSIIVSTTYGQVEGNTVQLDNGNTVHSWYGIPYAAPPIGNLRFQVGLSMWVIRFA